MASNWAELLIYNEAQKWRIISYTVDAVVSYELIKAGFQYLFLYSIADGALCGYIVR